MSIKQEFKDFIMRGNVIKADGAVTMNVGSFINTIISFLIVATAIFVVVKAINTLKKAPEAVEEAPAEPSEEVLLLREIRESLKK